MPCKARNFDRLLARDEHRSEAGKLRRGRSAGEMTTVMASVIWYWCPWLNSRLTLDPWPFHRVRAGRGRGPVRSLRANTLCGRRLWRSCIVRTLMELTRRSKGSRDFRSNLRRGRKRRALLDARCRPLVEIYLPANVICSVLGPLPTFPERAIDPARRHTLQRAVDGRSVSTAPSDAVSGTW